MSLGDGIVIDCRQVKAGSIDMAPHCSRPRPVPNNIVWRVRTSTSLIHRVQWLILVVQCLISSRLVELVDRNAQRLALALA